MYIHEAVKKAVKGGGAIYRTSVKPTGESTYGAIKPTNSYDSCLFVVLSRGIPQRSCRDWAPTANDLMADDWEVEF